MATVDKETKIKQQAHHERKDLCTNRPKYRQGRKLTAVKVYTVNDESRHLLINGVPAIAVASELKSLCETHGSIEEIRLVEGYPTDKFCEVYYVRYHLLTSARHAKIHLDDKSFFGGVLHVCYAPELETVEDTRSKLQTRKREILQRINPIKQHSSSRSQEYSGSIPPSSFPTETTSAEFPPSTNDGKNLISFAVDANPDNNKKTKSNTDQRSTPVKRIILHHRKSDGTERPLFKWLRTTDQ